MRAMFPNARTRGGLRALAPVDEVAHPAAHRDRDLTDDGRVSLLRGDGIADERHRDSGEDLLGARQTHLTPGRIPGAETDGDELAGGRGDGELHGRELARGQHRCAGAPVAGEHALEVRTDDRRGFQHDSAGRGDVADAHDLHRVTRPVIVLKLEARARAGGTDAPHQDRAFRFAGLHHDALLSEGGGDEGGDEGGEEDEHGNSGSTRDGARLLRFHRAVYEFLF